MNSHSNEITLIRPDDWHCHLRDRIYLQRTVPDIARRFNRAIVMPNLNPPITTVTAAREYLQRINEHIPADVDFTPLMTLYLTDDTTPATIAEAATSGVITACKLYPAGATFHSANGVSDIRRLYPVFAALQQHNMPLLVHGEVVDPTIDIFAREAVFVERTLTPLVKNFPDLRMVLEHVSSKIAVDFVLAGPANLAATITPHHLWLNRNDLLVNGIRPHHYCLPIVKQVADQTALLTAATSGNRKFFLGTDSAPHPRSHKEACCGPAGIYNAAAALELYTHIFDRHGALAQLENFASRFGAEFYQLPPNRDTITLIRQPWQVPSSLPYGDETLIPFMANETLAWRIQTP